MNSKTALKYIVDSGIVAGMRGAFPPDVALQVTEVMMAEGINCFEFMMNSDQPIEAVVVNSKTVRQFVLSILGQFCWNA